MQKANINIKTLGPVILALSLSAPFSPMAAAACDPAADRLFWESISKETDPAYFQAYLAKVRSGELCGLFSDLARLKAPGAAPASNTPGLPAKQPVVGQPPAQQPVLGAAPAGPPPKKTGVLPAPPQQPVLGTTTLGPPPKKTNTLPALPQQPVLGATTGGPPPKKTNTPPAAPQQPATGTTVVGTTQAPAVQKKSVTVEIKTFPFNADVGFFESYGSKKPIRVVKAWEPVNIEVGEYFIEVVSDSHESKRVSITVSKNQTFRLRIRSTDSYL